QGESRTAEGTRSNRRGLASGGQLRQPRHPRCPVWRVVQFERSGKGSKKGKSQKQKSKVPYTVIMLAN
ncbi:MAG: hypothetical protein ACXU95_14735, partial [Isosphaeraceae bacterium]